MPTDKPHSQKCDEIVDLATARRCGGDFWFNRYCGAYVCAECGNHKGLARCYCGWSLTSPGRGRQELEEMGEVIEPEDGEES
jgi:hypothetical protein